MVNARMTHDELLALPVTVDLTTAGRALGIGRTKAYELARTGTFPCRVLRIGHTYTVVVNDLWRLLGVNDHDYQRTTHDRDDHQR
jgi:hypothetical protein